MVGVVEVGVELIGSRGYQEAVGSGSGGTSFDEEGS
jgi:hypothetical protein